MKNILFVFLILLSNICNSQTKVRSYTLLELNGKNVLTQNLILASTKILDLNVVNRSDIGNYLGGNVDDVVLLKVKPQPTVHLINLNEFYNKYNITDPGKRNLPLNIDGKTLIDASDLIIDETSIQSVKIGNASVLIRTNVKEISMLKMKK